MKCSVVCDMSNVNGIHKIPISNAFGDICINRLIVDISPPICTQADHLVFFFFLFTAYKYLKPLQIYLQVGEM